MQRTPKLRDALAWRVKELHAQLIVLRGQSSGAGGALGEPDLSIWPDEENLAALAGPSHMSLEALLT